MIDTRSPYTAEEWRAYLARLKEEKRRRNVEYLPRDVQMALLDEVVRPMRRAEADARAAMAGPKQLPLPEPVGRGR